jgi:hypothetical protein
MQAQDRLAVLKRSLRETEEYKTDLEARMQLCEEHMNC